MNETRRKEKKEFFSSFKYAGIFLVTIWIMAFLQTLNPQLTDELGLVPRASSHTLGIVTMWLVHKDLAHLISNSSPLFLLTLFTLMFYPQIAWRVFAQCIVLAGGFLWCFGRTANHIGASGLIYALAAFLFFSGVFRRDRKSIAATLIVGFLYGSLVWGVFPIYKEISWDGHLFGAIAGGLIALFYRRHGREDESDPLNPPSIDETPYWHPDLPPEGRN